MSSPGANADDPTSPTGPTRLKTSLFLETNSDKQIHAEAVANFPNLPKYKAVRRLGVGGMGEVFEVLNHFGNTFALKVIRPDKADTSFHQRFQQEAQALYDLKHPNIIRIHDYDIYDGTPYFTMEMLRGGTLGDRIADFAGKPAQAVALMVPIVEAVAYLHHSGRIHRDLKPNNILLDSNGKPHLSDFGLVKEFGAAEMDTAPGSEPANLESSHVSQTDADEPAPNLTRTGAQMGTRPYMAPEQIACRKDAIGPASDIWALGVILHEMLSGHRPFHSREPSLLEEIIRNADPEIPLPTKSKADRELNQIVMRCLQKRPADRFACADELVAVLKKWQNRWAKPQSYVPLILASVAGLALTAIAVGIVFNWDGGSVQKPDSGRKLPTNPPLEDPPTSGRTIVEMEPIKPTVLKWIDSNDDILPTAEGKWVIRANGIRALRLPVELPKNCDGFRYRISMQSQVQTGSFGPFAGGDASQRDNVLRNGFFVAAMSPQEVKATLIEFAVRLVYYDPLASQVQVPAENVHGRDEPIDPRVRHGYEIDLNADRIKVSFDDKTVFRETRNALQRHSAAIAQLRRGMGFEDLTLTFSVRGGIGVYFNNSTVELSDITVIPYRFEKTAK